MILQESQQKYTKNGSHTSEIGPSNHISQYRRYLSLTHVTLPVAYFVKGRLEAWLKKPGRGESGEYDEPRRSSPPVWSQPTIRCPTELTHAILVTFITIFARAMIRIDSDRVGWKEVQRLE